MSEFSVHALLKRETENTAIKKKGRVTRLDISVLIWVSTVPNWESHLISLGETVCMWMNWEGTRAMTVKMTTLTIIKPKRLTEI